MIIKFSKQDIGLLFVLFCMFTPHSLYQLFLPDWFVYIKYGISVYLLINYFYKNVQKFEVLIILSIFLQLVCVISSFVNKISLTPSIVLLLNNVGWCILVRNLIVEDKEGDKLGVAVFYFSAIVTISLLLCFLFPEGLYKTNTQYPILDESTTFLGNDNGSLPYFFVSLLFSIALACKVEKYIKLVIYNSFVIGLFSFVRSIGTGIVCCLLMAVIWLILVNNKLFNRHLGFKIFLLGIGFFLLIVIFQVQQYFNTFLNIFNKSGTLGRIDIWQLSIQRISEQWVLGYGYTQGFDYQEYLYYNDFVKTIVASGNTHNVILQQMVMGGSIGTLIFVLMNYISLKHFDYNLKKKYANLLIAVFSGILLRSMVEIGSEYYFIYLPFFYYSQYLLEKKKY